MWLEGKPQPVSGTPSMSATGGRARCTRALRTTPLAAAPPVASTTVTSGRHDPRQHADGERGGERRRGHDRGDERAAHRLHQAASSPGPRCRTSQPSSGPSSSARPSRVRTMPSRPTQASSDAANQRSGGPGRTRADGVTWGPAAERVVSSGDRGRFGLGHGRLVALGDGEVDDDHEDRGQEQQAGPRRCPARSRRRPSAATARHRGRRPAGG